MFGVRLTLDMMHWSINQSLRSIALDSHHTQLPVKLPHKMVPNPNYSSLVVSFALKHQYLTKSKTGQLDDIYMDLFSWRWRAKLNQWKC